VDFGFGIALAGFFSQFHCFARRGKPLIIAAERGQRLR
jgi:hypothetical protein